MLDLLGGIKHDTAMAFNSLNLIIDVTDAGKAGIYSSFDARLPANLPLFVRNDGVPVTLRFVQPSATPSRPWDDIDLSAYSVALALGEFDVQPTSGTFIMGAGPTTLCTLNGTTTVTVTGATTGISNGMTVQGPGIVVGTTCTISGSTVTLSQAATVSGTGKSLSFYNPTSPLAYNISAANLATALNVLAYIITAGGVTVTALSPGNFLVGYVSAAAESLLISDPTGLNPASSIPISRVVPGSASVKEQQLIQIVANPYALTNTWTSLPAAAAIVTTVAAGSGSTRNVQSIRLNPAPYAGTFQITTDLLTTAAISFDSTAAQVQTALNANGAIYVVSGNANGPWTITAGTTGTKAAYTVNVSGLLVPVGLSGVLELSTFAMAQRFLESLGVSISLKFECQVTPPGGDDDTVLQLTSQVNKDVINFSRLIPSPVSNYPTTTEMNAAIAAAIAALGTASTLNFDTDGTLAANSDSRIATQKAVKTYIDAHALPAWELKSADFTAVAGHRYQVDTSGGPIQVTLPASAVASDSIVVEDAKLTWNPTNYCRLLRNGLLVNGGTSSYTGDAVGGKLSVVYISSGYGWSIK